MINKKQLFTLYMSWVVNLGQSMHYIQAWKIFTTKSAEDISLIAYINLLIITNSLADIWYHNKR